MLCSACMSTCECECAFDYSRTLLADVHAEDEVVTMRSPAPAPILYSPLLEACPTCAGARHAAGRSGAVASRLRPRPRPRPRPPRTSDSHLRARTRAQVLMRKRSTHMRRVSASSLELFSTVVPLACVLCSLQSTHTRTSNALLYGVYLNYNTL